jgi:hypothetical protein
MNRNEIASFPAAGMEKHGNRTFHRRKFKFEIRKDQ